MPRDGFMHPMRSRALEKSNPGFPNIPNFNYKGIDLQSKKNDVWLYVYS